MLPARVADLVADGAVGIPPFPYGDGAGLVLTQVVAAVVTVYTIVTIARAYDQLRGLEPPVGAPSLREWNHYLATSI